MEIVAKNKTLPFFIEYVDFIFYEFFALQIKCSNCLPCPSLLRSTLLWKFWTTLWHVGMSICWITCVMACGLSTNARSLTYPQRSRGVWPGEFDVHWIGMCVLMTRSPTLLWSHSGAILAVFGVAQSFWNHISSIFTPRFPTAPLRHFPLWHTMRKTLWHFSLLMLYNHVIPVSLTWIAHQAKHQHE